MVIMNSHWLKDLFSNRRFWTVVGCLIFGYLFCVQGFVKVSITGKHINPWIPSFIESRSAELRSLPTYDLDPEVPPAPHNAAQITVVTMFLDIGTFEKGRKGNNRGAEKYREWFKAFGLIKNPLVVFVEHDVDVELFRSVRSKFPANMTKVILIQKSDLDSFELLPRIRSIYADPNYPKHLPNTVLAEYSFAMHGKFDVLERVCLEDTFHTPYVMWVDIGAFRTLVSEKRSDDTLFEMIPPPEFNDSKVGYSRISKDTVLTKEPTKIVKENSVWVGGAVNLARRGVMLEFARDYKRSVRHLLSVGLSNSDQQVIASMYSSAMVGERKIEIQQFGCNNEPWFCLGYMCREAGMAAEKARGAVHNGTQS